jgi:hypothetical protein
VTKHGENRQRWHFILFIVKIKIQLQHYKYENKNQYKSEIISPLGNLELFQEQIQQGIPTILPSKNRMKMLSIMLEKKRNSLTEKKLALRNALRYFEAQHHEELIQDSSGARNLRSHLHVPLSSRL